MPVFIGKRPASFWEDELELPFRIIEKRLKPNFDICNDEDLGFEQLKVVPLELELDTTTPKFLKALLDRSTNWRKKPKHQLRKRPERNESESQTFQLTFPVKNFKPNEITVKALDDENILVVEGKHEEECGEHGFLSETFMRKITVPEDIKKETIRCDFGTDGTLKIIAERKVKELPLPPPKPKERIIPITHTGVPAKMISMDKTDTTSSADSTSPKEIGPAKENNNNTEEESKN